MSEQHKKARAHEHGCISLLDLPDSLISSVLRQLPTKEKWQAERVCKLFGGILGNPSPGDFVWDTVSLGDLVFQRVPLNVLTRQGLSVSSCSSMRQSSTSVTHRHGVVCHETPLPSLFTCFLGTTDICRALRRIPHWGYACSDLPNCDSKSMPVGMHSITWHDM